MADLRDAAQVPALLQGVSAVVCSTGTTAFPSSRWEGNNGPRPTDWVATSNLINAAAAAAKGGQKVSGVHAVMCMPPFARCYPCMALTCMLPCICACLPNRLSALRL